MGYFHLPNRIRPDIFTSALYTSLKPCATIHLHQNCKPLPTLIHYPMPAIIPSFSVLSETNVFQLLFSAPTCDHRPKIRYPTKTRQKNLRFPVFCFRLKSGSSVLPDYLNKSALKSFVNPISILYLA